MSGAVTMKYYEKNEFWKKRAEIVAWKYLVDRQSGHTIARELNMSPRTIYNMLDALKIPRRDQHNAMMLYFHRQKLAGIQLELPL